LDYLTKKVGKIKNAPRVLFKRVFESLMNTLPTKMKGLPLNIFYKNENIYSIKELFF
jgi:hypothetical protein